MKRRTKVLIGLSVAATAVLLGFAGKGIYGMMDYYYNNQVDAAEFLPTTRQVIINGQTDISSDIIRQKDEECYIPLSMLLDCFGWEASADRKLSGYMLHLPNKELYVPLGTGEGYVRTDGAEYPLDSGVVYVDGNFYFSTEFLEEFFGCHIYKNQIEGSERTVYVDNYNYKELDYSWVEENPYICHTMGLIDGYDYTNSLEAFQANYEKGYRVFEVDFQLTTDGKLAAVHGWSERYLGVEWDGEAVSLEEFLQIKIQGKYTSLSFYDIAELMAQYPDMYLVLDCKVSDYDTAMEQYQEVVAEAREVNLEVLDRVIPQIYSEEMLDWIRGVYDWKSIIYTLYQMPTNYSQELTIQFAYENGIRVMTMGVGKARDLFVHELLDRGIYTYVHTINSSELAKEYRFNGVWGFYTDELF